MMKYKALKDIATITMGQSPDSSSYNEEKNGIPFYQGNADFGELYPTARVWCSKPQKIAKENDILISVRAPIGALNYATEECCIGRGLAAITIENDFERNYVFHFLKAQNKELNNKGTGSTFKAISKSVLEEIQVPVISKEQQEISMKLLDIIEQIIRQRKQELQKLDELIKARFIEMFGEPENNNKAWPVKSLDKLCTVGSSKRVYQSEQSSEGVPFWRISDLVSKIDTGTVDSELFISEIKYTELKRAGLVPVTGDILVTSRGTLGRCYIVHDEDCFYFQDGMISWLSNYSEEITPLYLQYLFTMSGFRKQIDNAQAGSTVAYLSIAMLKKLQVMVPNKALQEQFAAFVEQVDKSKVAIQKSLEKTQLLFDSLMQKYFG